MDYIILKQFETYKKKVVGIFKVSAIAVKTITKWIIFSWFTNTDKRHVSTGHASYLKEKKTIHGSPEISTMYHAVHVNIYLECHLTHKYGCENVIGHGEEKPLLQKEKEEGEKKAKLWKE